MLNYEKNHLKFSLQEPTLLSLLENYDEPLYIYDGKHISERAQALKKALPPQTEIFYAVKANDHPEILQLFIELGYGMDVVSLGELQWCLRQGCPPQRIIFSGVGKTKKELIYTLKLGIRQINVESVPELLRISELCKQYQFTAPIGLRVNPDVDVHTHPYIATGLKNNKFGIEVSALEECHHILQSNPQLRFQGFSLHIGSQLLDLSACSEAFDKLVPLIQNWKEKGYDFKTLDAGGGLGIFYDQDSQARELQLANEWGQRLQKSWQGLAPNFFVEPGRWLVAHGGVLITRVEYIKKTSHHTFAVVDTGMHHLLRPALYQAKHRLQPLVLTSNTNTHSYQIVGPICESADVLLDAVVLPELKEGDFLAVLDAGAYGRVMSSHYNRRPFPQEVFLK